MAAACSIVPPLDCPKRHVAPTRKRQVKKNGFIGLGFFDFWMVNKTKGKYRILNLFCCIIDFNFITYQSFIMDLTRRIESEVEYAEALAEFDRLFHINDCCAIPDYGSLLYDRIKEYESQNTLKHSTS